MGPASFPSLTKIAFETPYGMRPKHLEAVQKSDIENFANNFDADFARLIEGRKKITNLHGLEVQLRLTQRIARIVIALLEHQEVKKNTPLTQRVRAIFFQLNVEDSLLVTTITEKVRQFFNRDEVAAIGNGTLLHLAVDTINIPAIQALLRAEVPIDARDGIGCTAFIRACDTNNLEIAGLLLAAGADVNAQTIAKDTALSRAITTFQSTPDSSEQLLSKALIHFLLDHQALCNIPDASGNTALKKAFFFKTHDSTTIARPMIILEMLDTKNPLLNFTISDQENTPLLDAMIRSEKENSKEWEQVALRLIDLGVDLNQTKKGSCPLLLAMKQLNYNLFQKLIEKGASLDAAIDEEQKDFASLSCFYNPRLLDGCIAGLRARKGKDNFINVDRKGNSLLQFLADRDDYLIETILSQDFATAEFLNHQNYAGETALHMLSYTKRENIIKKIITNRARLDLADKAGNTLLHAAAKNGCAFLVKTILEQDFATAEFINKQNEKGETALFLAVASSDDTILNLLLAKGARLDTIDKKNNTLLHMAVEWGPAALVQKILEQDFATPEFINKQNEKGETALARAAAASTVEIINLLLAKEARLDTIDKEKNTLLHMAVEQGLVFLVEKILTQQFATPEFINLKNNAGNSALHCCLSNPLRQDKVLDTMIQRLIEKGAQPLSENKEGKNFFRLVADTCKNEKLGDFLRIMSCIKGLLLRGVDLGNIDGKSNSVLHFIVKTGEVPLIRYMLGQNFITQDFINLQNEEGESALHIFLANSTAITLSELHMFIEKGAKLSFSDKKGNTLFHLAAKQITSTLAQELLQRNFANSSFINQANDKGETALAVATLYSGDETIQMFIEKGAQLDSIDRAGNTLLHHASRAGHLPLIQTILGQKFATADFINRQNNKKETALHSVFAETANIFHDTPIQMLLAHGARVDVADSEGKNVFDRAAEHGCGDECFASCTKGLQQYIVARGGFVYRQATLLHMAVQIGSLGLVTALLAQKFATSEFINCQNDKGETALHLAISENYPDIIQALIKKGAKVDIADKEGKTCFQRIKFKASAEAFVLSLMHEHSLGHIDLCNIDGQGNSILHLAIGCRGFLGICIFKQKFATAEFINLQNKNNETALHLAVNNDPNCIDDLIERGAKVEIVDKDGKNCFQRAKVYARLLDLISSYKRRVAPNFQNVDGKGNSLLHFAVEMGCRDFIERALSPDFKINIAQKNQAGETALTIAFRRRDLDSILLLLAYDFPLDFTVGADQMPPWHIVQDEIYKNFYRNDQLAEAWRKCIPILIGKKVPINACNIHKKSLLHIACEKGFFEDIKFFLDNGGDPNLKTDQNKTALMIIAQGKKMPSQLDLENLFHAKISLDDQDGNGATALMLAGETEKYDMARFLLDKGAHPDILPTNGRAPLHFIMKMGMGCDYLLFECMKRKVRLDARDSHGNTLLHAAVSNNQLEFFQYILTQNPVTVDVTARNNDGLTYIDCLKNHQNKNSFFKILFTSSPYPSLLEGSFLRCSPSDIKELVTLGLYTPQTLAQDFDRLAQKYIAGRDLAFRLSPIERFRIEGTYQLEPRHLDELPAIPEKPQGIDRNVVLKPFQNLKINDPPHPEFNQLVTLFGIQSPKDGLEKLEAFFHSLDPMQRKFDQIEAGLCHIAQAFSSPQIDQTNLFVNLFNLFRLPRNELYEGVLHLYQWVFLATLPENVNMESLLELYNDLSAANLPAAFGVSSHQEGKNKLTKILQNIKNRTLLGLNDKTEITKYQEMEQALAAIAAILKAQKADPIPAITDLLAICDLCATATYVELLELFHKTVRNIPMTAKNALLLSLENFRRSLLKAIIAKELPESVQTRHDFFRIVKAYPELALPESMSLCNFSDQFPHCAHLAAHQKIVDTFWKRYNEVPSILEWVLIEFLGDGKNRERFLDYMKTLMPKEFHPELAKQEDRELAFLSEVVYDAECNIREDAVIDALLKMGIIRRI
jgi:ankyrin repeat protein